MESSVCPLHEDQRSITCNQIERKKNLESGLKHMLSSMFKTIHGVVLSKNPNFLILQNKGKCRVAKYMEPSISMCDHDTWDNDEV
jgi:hypothetical protein